MNFSEKLQAAVAKSGSLVCVGLDSDVAKLPAGVDQLSFNRAIIDATHDLVAAYKPNTAFYEAHGAEGVQALKATCDYIRAKAPDALIMLDAKRADIGNTNAAYAQFTFNYLDTDAVTLQPYFGAKAIEPFLSLSEKGTIILCRTSNEGSGEFQDLQIGSQKLYEIVARSVTEKWNTRNNCMLVVGATYPEEAADIRRLVGDDMWFLIPGVGAQGGDVRATVEAAQNSRGDGIIISSSRDIIFASSGPDFAEAARKATETLRDEINTYRKGK